MDGFNDELIDTNVDLSDINGELTGTNGNLSDINGELSEECAYIQTLKCSTNPNHDENTKAVKKYVKAILNDSSDGVTFYKAHVSVSKDKQHFVLHLYLFVHVDQIITDKLTDTYMTKHLDNFTRVSPDQVVTQIHSEKRTPYYPGRDEEPGIYHIPGKNIWQKFINWWLIVPRVQWDFFDLLYQMYTFDITHQGFFPKFVHFFTIPCNVMLSMCFLAQFSFFGADRHGYGAYELNGSLGLFITLALLYLTMGVIRKTWTWGIATTVVLFVCWVTGNLWYAVYKTPGNPWYNPTTVGSNPILWSYIMSFIQASSHMAAPQLPPYITGIEHWESLHRFFCSKHKDSSDKMTSACFIVLALLGFPIFSVGVAWFSWPHLIGTQIIYIMAGIGYQHSDFKKYHRVVEKAELSGDPGLAQFPTDSTNLTQTGTSDGFVKKLEKHRILSIGTGRENADDRNAEIVKTVTAHKLIRSYFRSGVNAKSKEDMHYLHHVRTCLQSKAHT